MSDVRAGLSISPQFPVRGQFGRELLLDVDAQAHKTWQRSFDCRPASAHQPLP